MPVDMNVRNCDSERYDWEVMTLNVTTYGKMVTQGAWTNMCDGSERRNEWWLETPKAKKDGKIKCLNGYEKWLWRPNQREERVTLNDKLGNGSEYQKNDNTTLNTKTKKDGDSKCMNRYKKRLWMPKQKERSESKGLKEYAQWLWMPKWRDMVVDLDAEQKIDMMTLSVKLKTWLWVPNRRSVMALNAEMNDVALNAKLKDK